MESRLREAADGERRRGASFLCSPFTRTHGCGPGWPRRRRPWQGVCGLSRERLERRLGLAPPRGEKKSGKRKRSRTPSLSLPGAGRLTPSPEPPRALRTTPLFTPHPGPWSTSQTSCAPIAGRRLAEKGKPLHHTAREERRAFSTCSLSPSSFSFLQRLSLPLSRPGSCRSWNPSSTRPAWPSSV